MSVFSLLALTERFLSSFFVFCILYLSVPAKLESSILIAFFSKSSFIGIFSSLAKPLKYICKNVFACLLSIHSTISLSRHEQVCSSRLRFKRWWDDCRSISWNVAYLNIFVHDVINLLYYIEIYNEGTSTLVLAITLLLLVMVMLLLSLT